jgi:hypothetical protein
VALAVAAYRVTRSVQTPPSIRESYETLHRLAIASLLWPVLVVALLYGEWLLATWSLGHIPRPSIDDPKDIAGSNWLHVFTVLAILGALPAALLALGLNIVVIRATRPNLLRSLIRVGAVLVSWAVLVCLVKWDPGAVLYWWVD